MKFLVHGLGTEGRAAIDYLRHREADWLSYDAAIGPSTEYKTVSIDEAEASLSDRVYLRSPGVPPTDDLAATAASFAPLATTPTGLWLAEHAPAETVTVTGTKGKSSTTSLLAALFQAAGLTSSAYGNIGRPPLGRPLPEESHPVVEVSSFMMHDLPDTEHLHLITSLYTDHMDWHGSVDAYWAAKLRPFRKDRPNRGLTPRAVIHQFDLPPSVQAIEDVVSMHDSVMALGEQQADLGPSANGFHVGPLASALSAAAAVAHQFLSAETVARSVETVAASWKGLPSRQEIVPSQDDRLWINDALGTVPEATLAVLERFAGRVVYLIVGGADRGQSYDRLSAYLSEAADVHAIGHGTAGQALRGLSATTATFEEAVTMAADRAPAGSVILFSPAAPTAPPLSNYQERADIFRAAAQSVS